jgi:hypothetical protein
MIVLYSKSMTWSLRVARRSSNLSPMLEGSLHMQLAEPELAEISKHLTEAEALLAVLRQKPSQITAELGLGVIRGALFALDDSAADVIRAARTLQKLRLALATLNVPSGVHEHVSEAFGVLGGRHQESLRQVEASCLVDARYRQQSLRAELQGIRAELAGEDPAAALEPARRAQMLVVEIGERLGPTPPAVPDGKLPQEAMAELVEILGG